MSNKTKYNFLPDLYGFASSFLSTNKSLINMNKNGPLIDKLINLFRSFDKRMQTFKQLKNNNFMSFSDGYPLIWQLDDFAWTTIKEALSLIWQEKDFRHKLQEKAKKEEFDEQVFNVAFKTAEKEFQNVSLKMPFLLDCRKMLEHFEIYDDMKTFKENVYWFNEGVNMELNNFIEEFGKKEKNTYLLSGITHLERTDDTVTLLKIQDQFLNDKKVLTINPGINPEIYMHKVGEIPEKLNRQVKYEQLFYSDFSENQNPYEDIDNWCTFVTLNEGFILKIKMYPFLISTLTDLRKAILHW